MSFAFPRQLSMHRVASRFRRLPREKQTRRPMGMALSNFVQANRVFAEDSLLGRSSRLKALSRSILSYNARYE